MTQYPNDLSGVRLVHGLGKRHCGGCWMATLGVYLNNNLWTASLQAVDPVIRELCIQINDNYHSDDAERTADILKFGLLRPLQAQIDPVVLRARKLAIANYILTEVAVEYFTLLRATSVVEFLQSLPEVTAENCESVIAQLTGFSVRPSCIAIFAQLPDVLREAASRLMPYKVVERSCRLMKDMASNRLQHQHVTDGKAWRRAFRALTSDRWLLLLQQLIALGPCEECPDGPDKGYQAFYGKVGCHGQHATVAGSQDGE